MKYFKAEISNPIPDQPEVMVGYFETAPNPVGETILFGPGFSKKADVLNSNLYDSFLLQIKKPTRIVSISFCSGAMITGYPGRALPPKSATLDNFLFKILPALEMKYPQMKSPSGKYKLAGHSMGGSNAATLSASFPNLFSKVGLINPMFVRDQINPLAVHGLAGPTGAFSFYALFANKGGCLACLLINDHFPSESVWVQTRPSSLLKSGMPSTWITACKTDQFNLKPATDDYVAKMQALGMKPNYVAGKSGCKHDTFDGLSLAIHLEVN